MAKKRNVADATQRNVRASVKRDQGLTKRIALVEAAVRQTRSRMTAIEKHVGLRG